MLSSLEVALVLLAASVFAVVLLRTLGLPPMVAYLMVGIVVGPYATGIAGEPEKVAQAGELGVVFLMFTLGLEFSLPKLNSMRRIVLGLGGAQVGTSILAALAVFALLPSAWVSALFGEDIGWRGALVLGGAAAMSSTALVIKLLADRRELDTEHGRRVFGVLLFQDLAVIPLLILIPALAGGSDWLAAVGAALAKAAVLLVLLFLVGPKLLRPWFYVVARQRSHELFTLNVLLATLLFAWITSSAGLSMELGAFVAGMLIAETEYRFQVEEDIKPFRDVLLGLFFVSLGTRLDLGVLVARWDLVLLLLVTSIPLKFGAVLGLARLMGADAGTAVRVGVWLGQAGEFGFVLLSLAGAVGVLPPAVLQPVLAAMLLSLIASPLLIQRADRLALRFSSNEWMRRSLQLQSIAARSIARDRHVIVCGYGRCGQALAHVLEAEGVQFMALDLDPDRVRDAAATGESVVYGDASRRETLLAAGVHRARALAVTFDDTGATLRLLRLARELAPQLPILVRTAHEADIPQLTAAGATEVVPEIMEGSLMLASHALALAGVPMARVVRRIRNVRADRYSLLRGFFHGADDAAAESIEEASLHLRAFVLPPDSPVAGRRVGDLPLGGAHLSTVVRAGQRFVDPAPDLTLEAGDTLVLSGTIEVIGPAEARILGGGFGSRG